MWYLATIHCLCIRMQNILEYLKHNRKAYITWFVQYLFTDHKLFEVFSLGSSSLSMRITGLKAPLNELESC